MKIITEHLLWPVVVFWVAGVLSRIEQVEMAWLRV